MSDTPFCSAFKFWPGVLPIQVSSSLLLGQDIVTSLLTNPIETSWTVTDLLGLVIYHSLTVSCS